MTIVMNCWESANDDLRDLAAGRIDGEEYDRRQEGEADGEPRANPPAAAADPDIEQIVLPDEQTFTSRNDKFAGMVFCVEDRRGRFLAHTQDGPFMYDNAKDAEAGIKRFDGCTLSEVKADYEILIDRLAWRAAGT